MKIRISCLLPNSIYCDKFLFKICQGNMSSQRQIVEKREDLYGNIIVL
jgi:hypothetical protein